MRHVRLVSAGVFVVVAVGIAFWAACSGFRPGNAPNNGPVALRPKPQAGPDDARRGDFVLVKVEIFAPSTKDKRRICEKRLNIPIEKATSETTRTAVKTSAYSGEAFVIECTVEDFLLSCLSDQESRQLRALLGSKTFLYGVAHGTDSPSRYVMTSGGIGLDEFDAANQDEAMQKMESWLLRHFGSRFTDYAKGR